MQDLRKGNYMAYELGIRPSQCLIVLSLEKEREISSLGYGLYSRVTGSHVISSQTIRWSRQNARGYRHNTIVFLTMNNAIVVRPERLASS